MIHKIEHSEVFVKPCIIQELSKRFFVKYVYENLKVETVSSNIGENNFYYSHFMRIRKYR